MIIQEFAELRGFEAKEFVRDLSDESLDEIRLQMDMLKDDITKKCIIIKKELERRKSL